MKVDRSHASFAGASGRRQSQTHQEPSSGGMSLCGHNWLETPVPTMHEVLQAPWLIYAIITLMFIQLTRTDGVPVWLNAGFVVTIEPTRSGGSIVVPIGDGLDYEVREAPDKVLSLLEGAPPAKVVPVPPPKTLTPRPEDVSPEVNPGDCDKVMEAKDVFAPQKKIRKPKAASKKRQIADKETEVPEGSPAEERNVKPSEPAPKKKRASSKKMPSETVPVESPLPDGFEKIVEDLKSRKCRTVKRMRNAIKSFYGKTDEEEVERIIETMISRGHIIVEADGHVNWTVQVM